MWYVIFAIALLLFSSLEDIFEFLQSKNPDHQKKKEKQRLERAQARAEIVQQLKASINLECQIESKDLFLINNQGHTVNAKIINVDDDWVEIVIRRKRKKRKLLLRNENISSVSKIL